MPSSISHECAGTLAVVAALLALWRRPDWHAPWVAESSHAGRPRGEPALWPAFARPAFGDRMPMADIRLRVGVYGLTAFLAVVAIALYALIEPRAIHPGSPVLTWWMLAALYAVTETFVVHLSIGRETHTFSLNECPLVLGLFLAAPGDLLLGQLVGAAFALALVRRQSPRKLAFNLASFALSTAAAIAAFTLHRRPRRPTRTARLDRRVPRCRAGRPGVVDAVEAVIS